MDPHEPNISTLMERILYEVKRVVVGQDKFLERVMVAMLAQGHQQSLEEVVLAHDDALDLVQHPLHGSDAVEVDGACVHGSSRAAAGQGQ